MTPAEDKAYHRGRSAAARDARKINPGERSPCEFRAVATRRAWLAGYAAQENEAAAQRRTPEQEANVAGFCSAIEGWLQRTK